MSDLRVQKQEMPGALFKQLTKKVVESMPTEVRPDLIKWALNNWNLVGKYFNLHDFFNNTFWHLWSEFYWKGFQIKLGKIDLANIPIYDPQDGFDIPIVVSPKVDVYNLAKAIEKYLPWGIECQINSDYLQAFNVRRMDEEYVIWAKKVPFDIKGRGQLGGDDNAPILIEGLLIDVFQFIHSKPGHSIFENHLYSRNNFETSIKFYFPYGKYNRQSNGCIPCVYSNGSNLVLSAIPGKSFHLDHYNVYYQIKH